MKPISTRTLTLSGAWLINRAKRLCKTLFAGTVRFTSKRQVYEGYLMEAKRLGDRGSVNIIDFPVYLCLVGRYVKGNNFSLYFVQTLANGRDSYLPSTLSEVLDPTDDPMILGGYYARTTLGATEDGSTYWPTRYWGSSMPFVDAGAMHAYSGIAADQGRWPLTYAEADDEFVWRLVTIAPSIARFVDGEGVPPVGSPDPQAGWTLDIAESVLDAVGAKAFVRLLDQPEPGFELNWEAAQYPWMTIGRPYTFRDDVGVLGFRVTVLAQVVYKQAGPYYWTAREDGQGTFTGAWSEVSDDFNQIGGVPSGLRGLWAAEIEVINQRAEVLHHYAITSEDGDPLREAPKRSRELPEGYSGEWYMNNIFYRAPMETVVDDEGVSTSIAVCASFVNTTKDSYDFTPATGQEFKGSLFLDIHWFSDGGHRTQNLKTTELKRGVFYPDRIKSPNYNGTNASWDVGDSDDGRFTIGAGTDGTEVVFPVFSGFDPSTTPLLTIYVADADGVRTAYSGTPGFYMCMPYGAGEQAMYNYGEFDQPGDGSPSFFGRWITLPAPYDHVTYIGNNRYAFFVSSQIDSPDEDNYLFAPAGDTAVAVFDSKTGQVDVAGVIDPNKTSTGFGGTPTSPVSEVNAWLYVEQAYTVPVFANPPKLGRMEVVRLESDGYDPTDPDSGGNAATIIASQGHGQPGYTLDRFDQDDITKGVTWISYDSGASWAQVLDYGGPLGAYHCGSELAPRTDPIVRI